MLRRYDKDHVIELTGVPVPGSPCAGSQKKMSNRDRFGFVHI